MENNSKNKKWEPKTSTKIFIIVLFILCIIGTFGLQNETKKVNNKNDSNTYIRLDVQKLYNDYHDNEISADKKYSKNKYYFTGTIHDIEHFLTDNYIEIRYKNETDKNKIIEITAYFDNKEELLDIKKGDEVTIYGEFHQRSFKNYAGVLTTFSFKHCTFNKNS